MIAFGSTNVGLKRSINQDFIFLSEDKIGKLPNLFIVADGMGGHKAGDVASRKGVELFVDFVRTTDMTDPVNIIDAGIKIANDAVFELSHTNADYDGMGTTFVVASVIENRVYIANVGDSRLYLINNNIVQITRDHSLVEEMINMGEIERDAARTHTKKNIITRAVGVERNVVADIFQIEIERGDKLLLCSDGLSNMVEDYDIKKIVNGNSNLKDAVNILIDKANENGGRDNISVVLLEPEIGGR
ncbi:MAG: Stp1/IreP family PP2C-type Ser/Thr phosphatase [Lachnospiraceae bacterium]|jgi:protein phosphatase|nr:Stp1/IreP family PP2C-type Ser/Thr phosphatase [Lachnospiraceae bacterium]